MKVDKLSLLRDAILVSEIEAGMQTIGGVIIPDDRMKERGIKPRWCKVFKVGPDVIDVVKDDWVLVDHGRWSHGIEAIIEGEDKTFRWVDYKDILGKRTDAPNVNTI
jgi:co-chaperonin GroES (HSP10)